MTLNKKTTLKSLIHFWSPDIEFRLKIESTLGVVHKWRHCHRFCDDIAKALVINNVTVG